MKQKFLFVLPWLAVLGLLAGLASLVFFLIFRLLLLAVAVGIIVVIAGKIITKVRAKWMTGNGMGLGQPPYYNPLNNPVVLQPVRPSQQSNEAIIPIN